MKKFFAISIISVAAIVSGCAETAMTVPADAVVCSKASGCS
ncbi:MAG: hypothetical protein VYE27_03360 [Pseudomonadota bacterium]|nr:hypothetical protein [Pseudomonadota bacterium]